jgi:hypothetical protein
MTCQKTGKFPPEVSPSGIRSQPHPRYPLEGRSAPWPAYPARLPYMLEQVPTILKSQPVVITLDLHPIISSKAPTLTP